jgi:hypothetical protein
MSPGYRGGGDLHGSRDPHGAGGTMPRPARTGVRRRGQVGYAGTGAAMAPPPALSVGAAPSA